MLNAEIWGGAGEHGRSCYYVQHGRHSVLLDCGVKKEGSGVYPKLDQIKVNKLSAVFLSHSHEDHSMSIPLLYRYGYQGEVWTTRATQSQLTDYFPKWESFVKKADGVLPYGVKDLAKIRYRYLEDVAAAGVWFDVDDGLEACWGPSGHLIGSVWLMLRIEGKEIYYSGDYTAESRLLQASLPSRTLYSSIELAIVDAAYGDAMEPQSVLVDQLILKISQTLNRGGHVWLPVPAVGRGHELVQTIGEAFPHIQIVCDEGLRRGLDVLLEDSSWLKAGELVKVERLWSENVQVLSAGKLKHRSESMYPTIFFTSDPMLQSECAQALCYKFREKEENLILLTGHVYAGSYAAQLLADSSILSGEVAKCRYKIHQGLPDVRQMIDSLQPKKTLLVHAEQDKTDRLHTLLYELGYEGVLSYNIGDHIK